MGHERFINDSCGATWRGTHPAGHRALHARGGGQPCDLHAMMAIGSFLDNLDIGAQAQQDI